MCRLPYEIRWPGGLQKHLGGEYRVIEEAMCGRTTVWEDPLMPGRNGLEVVLRSRRAYPALRSRWSVTGSAEHPWRRVCSVTRSAEASRTLPSQGGLIP